MTDSDHVSHDLTPAGCASAGTGYLLPEVTLRTTGGEAALLDRSGTRCNLVVVLLGDGGLDDSARALLAELGTSGVRFEAEEARVVVISAGGAASPLADWSGPIPLLFDAAATLHHRLGAVDAAGRPRGAVYVTDRFREVYGVFGEGKPGWPPTVDEILRWLVFINIQCPECGVPEW